MIPQILVLTIYGLLLIRRLITGPVYIKFNFWIELLYLGIFIPILYWGGFWTVIKIPQIIMIVLFSLYLASHMFTHGERSNHKTGFWNALFGLVIELSIFYWGGFFDVFFK